jgi:hypothetical protein
MLPALLFLVDSLQFIVDGGERCEITREFQSTLNLSTIPAVVISTSKPIANRQL